MTFKRSGYLENKDDHDAALLRRIHRGIATEGVLRLFGALDLKATQDTGADMKVSIAPGGGVVQGDDAVPDQGSYVVWNDAAVVVNVTASDGTNDRIDLVCVVQDDTVYGGGDDDAVATVVAGTPGAIPVPPTLPDTALLLAQILVPALSTAVVNANITDKRQGAASNLPAVFARLTLSADQNIPTGTGGQQIHFDLVDEDEWGFADLTNHQLVVPPGLGGLYGLSHHGVFDNIATGTFRELNPRKNGASLGLGAILPLVGGSSVNWQDTVSGFRRLADADAIDVLAAHDRPSAALVIKAGASLELVRLGG